MTKIGTEVAHVTRDSDTTFKVKVKKVKGRRSRSPGRFTHRGINASGSYSGEHGNVLAVAVGNYCYVAVGVLGSVRRFGAHRGRNGAGHIVAAARLQLVFILFVCLSVRLRNWGNFDELCGISGPRLSE